MVRKVAVRAGDEEAEPVAEKKPKYVPGPTARKPAGKPNLNNGYRWGLEDGLEIEGVERRLPIPKDPLPPLTPKRMIYLRARLSGKNQFEAADIAGYRYHTTTKLEHDKNIQVHMQRAFATHGVTTDTLVMRVADALDAERVELDKAGNVRELGPDWRARTIALELAAKMTGALTDPRVKIEGTGSDGAIVVRHTIGLDD